MDSPFVKFRNSLYSSLDVKTPWSGVAINSDPSSNLSFHTSEDFLVNLGFRAHFIWVWPDSGSGARRKRQLTD